MNPFRPIRQRRDYARGPWAFEPWEVILFILVALLIFLPPFF
jgi:hypothetical protein